jgi:CheY-like chemotaxis protein
MLSTLLRYHGHTLSTATDGAKALRNAANVRPQVVLSAVALPDCSGFGLAPRLREVLRGVDCVVVARTGSTPHDKNDQRIEKAGFDRYLLKPARFEDIRATVDLVNSSKAC